MSGLPDGVVIGGIRYWPSRKDATLLHFLPEAPIPERDAKGRPTLTLMLSDGGGLLQFGVHWGGDPDQGAASRRLLAEAVGVLDPAALRFAPPPISVGPVVLLLGDGRGGLEEIARARSSGFPPFAALFNLPLDETKREAALAALGARRGYLVVRYTLEIEFDVAVRCTIAGEVREEVMALRGAAAPSAEVAGRLIVAALGAGRLAETVVPTGEAPPELTRAARSAAYEAATRSLLVLARDASLPPDRARLEVAIEREATVREALERRTDIGAWFEGGAGLDHIVPLSKGPKQNGGKPQGAARTVRLAFDVGDAPIAFVEIVVGGGRAVLRPPGFEPAKLDVGAADAPLVVKTHYTDGSPVYEAKLPPPAGEDCALDPAALGIARVTLDGSPLAASGARGARVALHYRPAAGGSADDRTIHLRRDRWSASWFVVTRSASLDGSIEFETNVTAADGSVVRHPAQTTRETSLRLTPLSSG